MKNLNGSAILVTANNIGRSKELIEERFGITKEGMFEDARIYSTGVFFVFDKNGTHVKWDPALFFEEHIIKDITEFWFEVEYNPHKY